MKKTDIIQLSIIILGIYIIIQTLETLTVQAIVFLEYQDSYRNVTEWIFGFIGIFLVIAAFGYYIIWKSEYFSNKIIKEENEISNTTVLTRSDTLTIAIIILSLYFLITGFMSVISNTILFTTTFFTDFKYFKESYSGPLLTILRYILVIIIFMKSKYISKWIENKIIK